MWLQIAGVGGCRGQWTLAVVVVGIRCLQSRLSTRLAHRERSRLPVVPGQRDTHGANKPISSVTLTDRAHIPVRAERFVVFRIVARFAPMTRDSLLLSGKDMSKVCC